jgi:hypothetical protein
MKSFLRALLTLAGLAWTSPAFAQGTEVETNHPCALAQDLGSPALPFTLSGALDALLLEGDVDFYRFQGTPGAGVEVDLDGRDAGGGTLRDPFLGLFDSTCQFVRRGSSDASGSSRLLTRVPSDGTLLLAVSGCCDFDFEGEVGVGGSYRLSIQPGAFLGAIRGRVVSGATGEPFDPGFPFPGVDLYRCAASQCDDWVGGEYPLIDGIFLFETDDWGDPLFAGRYQVRVAAQHHYDVESSPFDVGEAEDLDLGDFALIAIPRIGTVSGRVVDAVTGIPLDGTGPPYAYVYLNRCEGDDCSFEDSGSADDQGRFSFGEDPFRLLEPGTYRIEVHAEEYRVAETATFAVGEGEDVVVDDVLVTPFPVGFAEIRPCGDLPAEGGVCRYSVRLVNRLDERLDGTAWSIVESFSTGSLSDETEFQASARKSLRLARGASRVVPFSFQIPATARDGTFTCAKVYFGQGQSSFFFNTVGHRQLFCIQKGALGLRVLDEKQSRALLRERDSRKSGKTSRTRRE